MATDRQIAANRKNAQNSTGPHTVAGKAVSARNGIAHGFFTKRDYVRRSERAEYEALGARYFAELKPEGALEEDLVRAIITVMWRMRRCSLVEYELAEDNKMDPMQYAWNRDTQNSVDRARSQTSLSLRRSLLELRRLQTDRFLARELLSERKGLPPVAGSKQILTAIDQHCRAQAQPHQQKLASLCKNESSFLDPVEKAA